MLAHAKMVVNFLALGDVHKSRGHNLKDFFQIFENLLFLILATFWAFHSFFHYIWIIFGLLLDKKNFGPILLLSKWFMNDPLLHWYAQIWCHFSLYLGTLSDYCRKERLSWLQMAYRDIFYARMLWSTRSGGSKKPRKNDNFTGHFLHSTRILHFLAKDKTKAVCLSFSGLMLQLLYLFFTSKRIL